MAFVEYTVEDRVAIVRMNRPERLNALSPEVGTELRARLWEFAQDDNLWVCILTGTGRSFCAGRDIKAQVESGATGYREYTRQWNVLGMPETNKPLIAAVNGYAIGAGWYMTLACDIRIAAESAQFGMGEIPTGLLGPYWFSSVESLPWCIGAELTLIGDRIDARKAYQYGLVNEVVADDQVMDAARRWAERFLALPPLHVQRTKALMRSMRGMPTPEMLEREYETRVHLNSLDDTMEAARAFAEKRTGVYKGR